MYILKNSKEHYIVETTTDLSYKIGVHRTTIHRWFSTGLKEKIYKEWVIIIPILIKDSRKR